MSIILFFFSHTVGGSMCPLSIPATADDNNHSNMKFDAINIMHCHTFGHFLVCYIIWSSVNAAISFASSDRGLSNDTNNYYYIPRTLKNCQKKSIVLSALVLAQYLS